MDIEALFAEHHQTLFRYLARLSGDPDGAADAVQETFVRLLERPPREAGNIRAWLYKVGTNFIREANRTTRRRSELLHAEPLRGCEVSTPTDPHVRAERRELRRVLRAALEMLTERERTILLMREEGFTHREIATAVGTTTKSVGTLITRALRKVARQLSVAPETLV